MRRINKANFFYGWIIVIASFFVLIICGGVFYSFGIFFEPLEVEFGWSRASISSVNTFLLLAMAVSTYTMGRLTVKYGPRRPLIAGALIMGIGLCLCSQAQSLWQLRAFYILVGLGSGATWVIPTATVQRWFMKRRALVLGIVVSGVGLGALVFAPLIDHVIFLYGWRTTYILLGSVSWAVLTAASVVMVMSPEKKGLKPYGAEELALKTELTPGINKTTDSSKVWTTQLWSTKEAIRSKSLWGLVILYALTLIPIYMISTHIVRFALDAGISGAIAASALGLIGGMSIAGRLVMGGAADKIGWKTALAICCFFCGAAAIWLTEVNNLWMLYLFVVIYGFFYGGKVPQIPGLVGFFFGTSSLAEITGIIHALSVLVGAAGPLIAGYIFDKTGSYTIAFSLAAASFIAAGILALVLKPPRKIIAEKKPG